MTLKNYKLIKDKTTPPVEGEVRYKKYLRKTEKEQLDFFQWTNGEWKYYPIPEEFRKPVGGALPAGTVVEDRDKNGEVLNLREKQADGSWKYLPKPEEYRKKIGNPGLPDGSIREIGTRTYEKQNGEWVLIDRRSKLSEHPIGTVKYWKVGTRSVKKIKTEEGWKTVYKDRSEYKVPDITPIGKSGPRPELRSLVYGVGINDVMIPYFTRTRTWRTWCGIIRRTDKRDPKWLSQPGKEYYADCTLDPRWYELSVFKEWIEKWDDFENKEVDKDLLIPGNKVYGPDTCLMVRPIVNAWFKPNVVKRGDLPRGVSWNTGWKKGKSPNPYRAQITPIGGKRIGLGVYATIEEASSVFEKERKEQIKVLIETETDLKVKNAMVECEFK